MYVLLPIMTLTVVSSVLFPVGSAGSLALVIAVVTLAGDEVLVTVVLTGTWSGEVTTGMGRLGVQTGVTMG